MRIAFVSQEYPPETAHGGIGSQTYLKAHGMALLGHEVIVISHSTDADRHEYQDGPVRVIRVPSFDTHLPIHTLPVRWLTYSAQVAAAVAAVHAQTPLDLVDFPEWGGEGYIHLLNQTEWHRVPTLVHLQGPLVMFAHALGWPAVDSELYRAGSMMEATCLRLADSVYSSSRCSAEWCARYYGLNLDQTPVLHAGVDTRLFYPHETPKADRPTILFVGKISASKGVDTLVEAACHVARDIPNLQVRLLGRGDERLIARSQQRAQEAGFPDLLEFVGFVPREALPRYLSHAHLFAAPSRYEGGPGFVYLEAMACALSVIACTGSGAAEVVFHEENGLLVAPDDAEALAVALQRLLSNPAFAGEMGQRALQYVTREASHEVCLPRLGAFYESSIQGERGQLSDGR